MQGHMGEQQDGQKAEGVEGKPWTEPFLWLLWEGMGQAA